MTTCKVGEALSVAGQARRNGKSLTYISADCEMVCQRLTLFAILVFDFVELARFDRSGHAGGGAAAAVAGGLAA
eukprot:scaffold206136_cov23-Prasinocladus_malaysianus.AAC.1